MDIQLLVNLKVYRERFHMENYIGTHNIFALVKSGRFTVEAEDEKFTVSANEGALFRGGILYNRKIVEPTAMYLFRFISDAPVFGSDHVIFKDNERIMSTISMLQRLDSGIFKDEFEYRKNLFMDIVTQYSLENNIYESNTCQKENPIEKAIALISENIHKKLVLSEIGAQTGLSYVQFLRRFQSYTGMSPSDYVTLMRIQKAKSLLTDTNLMVKDIAVSCGFENEYYFSNFFKKHIGMSPSAFRNITV